MDVHVVPLHRALSGAVFEAAGLSFPVFVAVLAVLHCIASVYALSTFRLLLPSPLAGVLAALYAASIFAIAPLGYWSSGAQRFPLAVALFGATFHYLRWSAQTSRKRDAALALSFLALGLGFYSKAVLIPLYLLLVSAALGEPYGLTRRSIQLLSVLGGLALTYVALYRMLLSPGAVDLSVGSELLWRFLSVGAEVFVRGVALDASVELPTARLGTALGLAVVALASIALAPRSALAWGGLFVAWVANWALLAASPRGQMFGIFSLIMLRYQFELLGVVLLFLAAAVRLVLAKRIKMGTWLLTPRAAAACFAFVVAYALASGWTGVALAKSSRYDGFRKARDYMNALGTSLDRMRNRDARLGTKAAPLRLARGEPPPDILGKHQERYGDWRTFLRLFDVRVTYKGAPRYRVMPSGAIVRVRPEKRRGARRRPNKDG